MGLFVRKSTEQSGPALYTTSHKRTVLIVGLGNVGKEYDGTRHNIGFDCVDAFAGQQDFPAWMVKKDLKCQLTKKAIGDTQVIVIKPTTFMNKSGEAVQATQHFYKISNSQTVVVHDELDIAFGQIRTRVGGSDAGNNGVKSLIMHLGPDFARIRVGIKNDLSAKMDSASFVLAKFNKEEKSSLPALTKEVSILLDEYLASGDLPHDTRTIL